MKSRISLSLIAVIGLALGPRLAIHGATLPTGENDVSNSGLQTASPAVPALTSEKLLADLSQDLTARYRTSGELQLELGRAWTAPEGASDRATLFVLEAPPTLSSSMLVRVRIQAGPKTLGESTLVLRAQLLRDVWVSRAPSERGAAFDPSALDSRRVDTLRERDTIAVDDSATDLTFTHGVSAGRLLTWRDVAHRALVRKGEMIEVSAIDGALVVNMKALAMENGSAGETVRIRNQESKKEFMAQVVSDAHAEIRL